VAHRLRPRQSVQHQSQSSHTLLKELLLQIPVISKH
jgi:hypothetical protein